MKLETLTLNEMTQAWKEGPMFSYVELWVARFPCWNSGFLISKLEQVSVGA